MKRLKMNKNILHLGITLLLSLLFTGMTAVMTDFFMLFIFFFISLYLLVLLFENVAVKEIAKLRFNIAFSDVLYDMVKKKLTSEEFEFLYIKLSTVKDTFFKEITESKGFNSFIYNPVKEFNVLQDITKRTVGIYSDQWIKKGYKQENINMFNEIHNPNTEKYFNKIKRAYESKASIYERQRVVTEGLIDLLFESVDDYIKTLNK